MLFSMNLGFIKISLLMFFFVFFTLPTMLCVINHKRGWRSILYIFDMGENNIIYPGACSGIAMEGGGISTISGPYAPQAR